MMPEGVKSKLVETILLISSIGILSDSKVFINIEVGSAITIAYEA